MKKYANSSRSRFSGFTLIELLVVIAIIGILAGMLFPVLSKSKLSAVKAQCANNLKQWGVAVIMYAGENHEYFPDNTGPGATDPCWMADSFTNFYSAYLYPNHPGTTATGERSKNDVLYCPTAAWTRTYEAGANQPNLIGYNWLPCRSTNFTEYTVYNLDEWFYQQKLGGRYYKAPILVDQIQTYQGFTKWMMKYNHHNINYVGPASAHAQNGGLPSGGNFLYQDGHVGWLKFDGNTNNIAPMARNFRKDVYYGAPGGLGAGPW